jgi:hypothetical protein
VLGVGAIRTERMTNRYGDTLALDGDISPFQHVGLIPAQAFRATAAAIMRAIAAAAALGALWIFGRRDLVGA